MRPVDDATVEYYLGVLTAAAQRVVGPDPGFSPEQRLAALQDAVYRVTENVDLCSCLGPSYVESCLTHGTSARLIREAMQSQCPVADVAIAERLALKGGAS